jgi:hypothetical protein
MRDGNFDSSHWQRIGLADRLRSVMRSIRRCQPAVICSRFVDDLCWRLLNANSAPHGSVTAGKKPTFMKMRILKAELKWVTEARDIQKKTVAYFAKG